MKKKGMGIAASLYPTGMTTGGDSSQAQVKVQPDGTAVLTTGASDIGDDDHHAGFSFPLYKGGAESGSPLLRFLGQGDVGSIATAIISLVLAVDRGRGDHHSGGDVLLEREGVAR